MPRSLKKFALLTAAFAGLLAAAADAQAQFGRRALPASPAPPPPPRTTPTQPAQPATTPPATTPTRRSLGDLQDSLLRQNKLERRPGPTTGPVKRR